MRGLAGSLRRRLGCLERLGRSARGAATAEYALLLALVVIILIGTLAQLGQVLNEKLQGIIANLNDAR